MQRYAFGQQELSMYNRAQAAAMDRTLADYADGQSSFGIPFLTYLWAASDMGQDWGGEGEGIPEIYKDLDAAYRYMMPWQPNANTPMSEARMVAEDIYQEAEAMACDFENKLYLAICLVNATEAIQGSAGNVFGNEAMYKRVNDEFARDRLILGNDILDHLKLHLIWAEFFGDNKPDIKFP